MKKAKRDLLICLAIFAVAFGTLAIISVSSASGTLQTSSEQINETEAPAITPVQESPEIPETPEKQATESAPDATEIVQTYQQPSQPQTTPQAQPKQEMERIPFTNKPVEAGNPESYVGTYGQCPFYENAMEGKGCVPPPDIECNEDWSKCEYIGGKNEQ